MEVIDIDSADDVKSVPSVHGVDLVGMLLRVDLSVLI